MEVLDQFAWRQEQDLRHQELLKEHERWIVKSIKRYKKYKDIAALIDGATVVFEIIGKKGKIKVEYYNRVEDILLWYTFNKNDPKYNFVNKFLRKEKFKKIQKKVK